LPLIRERRKLLASVGGVDSIDPVNERIGN
jgi:hypothetical protein